MKCLGNEAYERLAASLPYLWLVPDGRVNLQEGRS